MLSLAGISTTTLAKLSKDQPVSMEVMGPGYATRFLAISATLRFVAGNERLIVVISDGLRYESAAGLSAILNREQKGSSELEVMLGVIPSYTVLGMASLLPHKNISITDKADIEIDGISARGTDNRGKILKLVKEESVVTTYDYVMGMTKQKMADKFYGVKLIYIYHNTIDARGDNAATRHEVFEATEKRFREPGFRQTDHRRTGLCHIK